MASLAGVVLLACLAYYFLGRGGLSLEALVRNRMAIDGFVSEHRVLAVLAYIGLYIAAVALSVPGAIFLTVAGGFLFGVAIGASAAVIGATIGATLIFLVARTALGEQTRGDEPVVTASDHHDVDGARTYQHVGDFERLFTSVRL